MALILDGKTTAAAWRAELAAEISALKAAHGIVPGLAVVWVGENPASAVYVRNKGRAAEEAGIRSSLVHLPESASQHELESTLDRLGADPLVHGILVQLPLPPGLAAEAAQERIPPAKDVDCLHPVNQGLLALGRPRFVSATPLGIVELLRRYAVPVSGAHAVIIGRSAIVGRPLAALLSRRGPLGDATVTLCHSRTRDLAAIARSADILVAASGQPDLVTAAMVRPGATVIDVGINRVPAPGTPSGSRLVGDVDFAAVAAVAGAVTPVPGGVGPMTIAALVHNTVAAARALAGAGTSRAAATAGGAHVSAGGR
jgi:methylenetetrahydrofolate dehydrogenase (NADP+)/methenyltetrahydrofolate cyclohydrolase